MTSTYIKKMAPVLGFALLVGGLVACFFPGRGLSQEPDELTKLDTGFYYTVKKGDTLWDLSQRFFDSPWIWPDMWETNEEIPNPHWIYPGNKLRIYSREDWDRLQREKDRGAAAATLDVESPHGKFYVYSPMDSVGFVKKEALQSSGYIFKVREAHKEIIGEGDVVNIRPSPGNAFQVGERYTVYRVLETFKDKTSNPQTVLGSQHLIVGLADVVEIRDGIATAIIHRSFRNIELNDLVILYKPRSPRIKITESAEGIRGTIFALEDAVHFFGDGAVAFVNKGQKDGIQVGQYYEMFLEDNQTFGSGEEKHVFSLAPIITGKLLVLHVEENASTALITSIHNLIEPGMEFRTP